MDDRAWKERLAEAIATFSVRVWSPEDIVRIACDALVDDIDSPALRQLAGATSQTSVHDIEDLVPFAR